MAETITLRAYLDELEHLLDQDAPTEVISHCRHILQHFPQNVATYRLLGKALLQKAHQDDAPELFGEAAEVFRRVLGVLPDDYVAHLGLSEIADQQEDLNRAIWHLERAFEQMPGNAALQDALRELYVRRDGEDRAPARIQLTRGALARQYIQGQLYEQAIAELRVALAHQPQRTDLQALLAEALWANQHPVEAGEVAIELLKQLPNCLTANRIMAELWLANERPTDARPFLDRVAALDPYLAARILKPDGDLPDTIELPRLDYYRYSQAILSAEAPGWVQELGTPGQDISMQDLFTVPSQQTEKSPSQEVGATPQLDMAALFGEIPVPDMSTLWNEEHRPGDSEAIMDSEQFPTPDSADDFPMPDVPWLQATPSEIPGGADDDLAIEADWILDTDQPEEEHPEVEEIFGQKAAARADEPDLWQALSASEDVQAEDMAQPARTFEWAPAPEAEGGASEADFLDRLGDTPDFGGIGTEEIDWSVFEDLSEESSAPEPHELASQAPLPASQDDMAADQQSDKEIAPAQWTEEAERLLDVALEHPDEQELHQEIDAAFEEILATEDLLGEAAEPITIPEWLPGPDEAVSAEDQHRPSLGELVAALSDEQAPEPVQESAAIAALDESLQWLGDTLDADGDDLLAALAAAGQQDQQTEDTAAEPAAELPDWIREAAPLAEGIADEAGQAGSLPEAAPDDEMVVSGVTDIPVLSEEPEFDLLTEWEVMEVAQATPSDLSAEKTGVEEAFPQAEIEEDWLQALAAEPMPDTQPEIQETVSEEPSSEPLLSLAIAEGEMLAPADALSDLRASAAEPPAETPPQEAPEEAIEAQAEEATTSAAFEAPAQEVTLEAEPGWLADVFEEKAEHTPAEELETLLSQPYDPFEGGSADKVPRYQAADKTGILQPDEQPDWMTAFLGDEVPDTGELPETAAMMEEVVTRPLFEDEEETPLLEEQPDEAETAGPTAPPADEWTAAEETPPAEGEVPEWLIAIADSEADKLSELFATDELFTLPEEMFTDSAPEAEEPGAEGAEQAAQDKSSLHMPETLEAFFTAESLGEEESEAQPLAEPPRAAVPEVPEEWPELAPASALPDTWSEEVSLEQESAPSATIDDEYADEPVPEDFSFGDWVPIWLRTPLEGLPDDLPGPQGDAPPTPPEWLRDVAEEDE